MVAEQKSLDERFDEVQHFAENQEKYREQRINQKKREAATKLKAAGQDGILSGVKDVLAAFKGSHVEEITLGGETIFKMEPPIDKPAVKAQQPQAPQHAGLKPPRQF